MPTPPMTRDGAGGCGAEDVESATTPNGARRATGGGPDTSATGPATGPTTGPTTGPGGGRLPYGAPVPVDPDLAALLERRAGAPPLFEGPPAEARARFAAELRTTARPDDRVPEVLDGPVPVRLVRPRAERAERAEGTVVVFLHGGGWVVGGGDAYDAVAARLADDVGAPVASVDYRLAPEHPFPAAFDDALTAIRRVLVALAPERWALVGDSAGANLAAGAAIALRDDDVRPKATLLFYPATDFEARYPSMVENAEGYWLEARDVVACSRLYLDGRDPRGDPRLSPLRAPSLAGLAPTVVATAGHDPLRDAGAAFVEALVAAGSPAVLREHPDLVHGFVGFTAASPAADGAVADLHAELAAHLAPGGAGAVAR